MLNFSQQLTFFPQVSTNIANSHTVVCIHYNKDVVASLAHQNDIPVL